MSLPSLPDCLELLGQTLAEFRAERAGFEDQVERLLNDLEQLRRELVQRGRERDEHRSEEGAGDGPVLAKLRARLAQVQSERDDLRHQVTESLGELTKMNHELGQLRKLIERQAQLPLGLGAMPSGTSAAVENAELGQPSTDPVVQAVMAQFARIKQ